jgi:DAACS family dicarboxylate/amino acid:cation (Na+ or H+) symporter
MYDDAARASASRPPRLPLLTQLLLALVAGGIVGAVAGPRAAVCGELATWLIRLLKLLATPLIFFAIVDTFASTRLPARRALLLFPLSAVNAAVAAGLALGLANALPLGRFVDLPALRALVTGPPPAPPSAIEQLLFGHLLWIIGAALLAGVALRLSDGTAAAATVGRAARAGLRLLLRALGLVVRAVPLAAFGIMAKVVGTSGLRMFPVLGLFVTLVALGIGLQLFGWYSILLRLVARVSPGGFFRRAVEPMGTALATGSSLATLPVTLRTLEGPMQISTESARLAAVVGTNLNHDGIILYEAAAAVFVAQLFGIHATVAQQLHIVALAVLAAVGIAGVPEAGLLTLSLVLDRTGLPSAAVPLLLPVDWLLGRLRATANVTSDMVVATLLDRLWSRRE